MELLESDLVLSSFQIVGDAVGWGFVVRGSKPCHIQAVDPSGPAAAAGMKVSSQNGMISHLCCSLKTLGCLCLGRERCFSSQCWVPFCLSFRHLCTVSSVAFKPHSVSFLLSLNSWILFHVRLNYPFPAAFLTFSLVEMGFYSRDWLVLVLVVFLFFDGFFFMFFFSYVLFPLYFPIYVTTGLCLYRNRQSQTYLVEGKLT